MRDKIKRQSFNQSNRKSFSGSFKSSKKERKNHFLIIAGLIVFLLVVLSLLYFLFLSHFFNIKEIKVEGAGGKTEQIEELVGEQVDKSKLLFSQENILLFNKNKILETLSCFNFSTVSINKSLWKRHLIIKISEREEALIYLENGEYYFLDKLGNIIKSQTSCDKIKKEQSDQAASIAAIESDQNSSSTEIKIPLPEIIRIEDSNCIEPNSLFIDDIFLPLVENTSENKKISQNEKYIKLEEEYLSFVFKLHDNLNNSSDLGFKKIILDEECNTIKVKLNNNLDIYLSLKNDYSEQMSKFFTLSRERASDLNGKKYIDLRYGDKIFYY